MENLAKFINLYKSYDKKDEDPIKNQYNNAFFLREVQKALYKEKDKNKKDKNLPQQEKNIKKILNYLNRFINAKSYYEKFESYRNIKGIMRDLNNIEQNIDGLQIEIDKLIYDIELENNEYILNYNYIEEKLDEIVRQIARERM
ncbi:MAG: hypothetical protein E6356_15985 [Terrisporobacter othiniensis]|uniref:hypothetical protein n=1 Tax=Terrisporobacter petrolearius TaxID=1460447 RepID=UPI001D1672F4|nr:hypothetical protein [Terrisporobacter petrolearius]MCC3863954.1 hypothetical protein [Terrisporobacter petrolearius]MDU4860218.1 hypothetical protein [Terrisporobacter othiniensis]MDU6996359.1 hypothetical protein [Terrisporobacter othiniensis]